jgi:hypothetical protein
VALATDGTEEAARRFVQDGPGDRLARDPLDVLFAVEAILEIAVREHVDEVDELDEPRRPQLAQEALTEILS